MIGAQESMQNPHPQNQPETKGKRIMADGSSLRKPNVDGNDRPGNRKRKNPSAYSIFIASLKLQHTIKCLELT
uniref:Uncharacterized protein n=1 Tax=Helianthus annuus TaxID=4232 RepID=A0A251VFU3_HELAN